MLKDGDQEGTEAGAGDSSATPMYEEGIGVQEEGGERFSCVGESCPSVSARAVACAASFTSRKIRLVSAQSGLRSFLIEDRIVSAEGEILSLQ